MRTLLTIDDDRLSIDGQWRTRDGLRVSLTSNPDLLGEAGYAGSPIYGVDALCSGLIDDSFEDQALLPRTPENEDVCMQALPHAQRFARGMPTRKPSLTERALKQLLTGKQKAAIPHSRLAEMATLIERRNPHVQHEEILLNGFYQIAVIVEYDGRTIVYRTISGVPAGKVAHSIALRFVRDAVAEARDLLSGGFPKWD